MASVQSVALHWGIFDRVWLILQEYEPHSDAMHEFPDVYRRPESRVNRIAFELAYYHCFYFGTTLALMPGTDDGPTSTFFQ